MKIIFVSGAYRANSKEGISQNIETARIWAIKLWQLGFAVICPQLNSAHFDGACDDEVWIEGYKEILRRCDYIFMLPNWEKSEGAKAELEMAKQEGIDIIHSGELI